MAPRDDGDEEVRPKKKKKSAKRTTLTPREKAEEAALILNSTRARVKQSLRIDLAKQNPPIFLSDTDLEAIVRSAESKYSEAFKQALDEIEKDPEFKDKTAEQKTQAARRKAAEKIIADTLKEKGVESGSLPDTVNLMAAIYGSGTLVIAQEDEDGDIVDVTYRDPFTGVPLSPLEAVKLADDFQRQAVEGGEISAIGAGTLAPVAQSELILIAEGKKTPSNPSTPIVYVKDQNNEGTDGISKKSEGKKVFIDGEKVGKGASLRGPLTTSAVTVMTRDGSPKPALLVRDADGFMVVIDDPQVIEKYKAGEVQIYDYQTNKKIANPSKYNASATPALLTKGGDVKKDDKGKPILKEQAGFGQVSADLSDRRPSIHNTYRIPIGMLKHALGRLFADVVYLSHQQVADIVGGGTYDKNGESKARTLNRAFALRGTKISLLYTSDKKGRSVPVLRITWIDSSGNEQHQDIAISSRQAKRFSMQGHATIRVGSQVAKVPLSDPILATDQVVQIPVSSEKNANANASQKKILQSKMDDNKKLGHGTPVFNKGKFDWAQNLSTDLNLLRPAALIQLIMTIGISFAVATFFMHMPFLIAMGYGVTAWLAPKLGKYAFAWLFGKIGMDPNAGAALGTQIGGFAAIIAGGLMSAANVASRVGIEAAAARVKLTFDAFVTLPLSKLIVYGLKKYGPKSIKESLKKNPMLQMYLMIGLGLILPMYNAVAPSLNLPTLHLADLMGISHQTSVDLAHSAAEFTGKEVKEIAAPTASAAPAAATAASTTTAPPADAAPAAGAKDAAPATAAPPADSSSAGAPDATAQTKPAETTAAPGRYEANGLESGDPAKAKPGDTFAVISDGKGGKTFVTRPEVQSPEGFLDRLPGPVKAVGEHVVKSVTDWKGMTASAVIGAGTAVISKKNKIRNGLLAILITGPTGAAGAVINWLLGMAAGFAPKGAAAAVATAASPAAPTTSVQPAPTASPSG